MSCSICGILLWTLQTKIVLQYLRNPAVNIADKDCLAVFAESCCEHCRQRLSCSICGILLWTLQTKIVLQYLQNPAVNIADKDCLAVFAESCCEHCRQRLSCSICGILLWTLQTKIVLQYLRNPAVNIADKAEVCWPQFENHWFRSCWSKWWTQKINDKLCLLFTYLDGMVSNNLVQVLLGLDLLIHILHLVIKVMDELYKRKQIPFIFLCFKIFYIFTVFYCCKRTIFLNFFRFVRL